MKTNVLATLVAFLTIAAHAAIVYTQPPTGGLLISSRWSPNGSDYDQYVWDNFSVSSNLPVTEVQWQGGYAYNGAGGRATGFTISFYSSIGDNSQPDLGSTFAPSPLATYTVSGNAGETPAGNVGGVARYDYDFVLPTPFQATAGKVYWIQIEAAQPGIPDWGIATGSGGDGSYFRRIAYIGDLYFQIAPGDAAFTILTSDAPVYSIAASSIPSGSGSVTGAGLYAAGMTAPLVATPGTNSAFANWTDNGTVVSTSPNYSFTVTSNRTLVANFVAGSMINTVSLPAAGGTTTGGGNYANGTSATVTARTNANYSFVNWTENGVQVSASSSYTFTVTTNRLLVANFNSAVTNLVALFSQPPSPSGGAIPSSFFAPDGFDGDGYCFDSFTLGSTQDIIGIQWRGAYRYGLSGNNPVTDFTIKFYFSIAGGSQPDVGSVFTPNPLKTYHVGGNAFETFVGNIGGLPTFDYHFTLPTSFHALGGTKYLVQIEASQLAYLNDWGISFAAAGDGTHFEQVTGGGVSGSPTGDAAFTLLGDAGTNISTIVTTSQPATGGLTSGDGIYANGLMATVSAMPASGYAFVGWSVNGATASTNAMYQFLVTSNEILSAIFAPTFTVNLSASPASGGTVSGAGTFLALATVNAVAHPNAGYSFVNWTESAAPVCTTTDYSFPLTATRSLVANFTFTPLALTATRSSGTNMTITWSPPINGWILQESPDLVSWSYANLGVTIIGNQRSVTISPQTDNKFFRLYHP